GTGCLCICAAVACVSRVVAATAVVAICLAADPALAQKHGGTLRVYISANPSSLSILEEVSFTTVMAAGPVFNGLVVFDPMKPIGGIDTGYSRACRELVVERGRHQPHLQPSAGCQMAPPQALHPEGRSVHLALAQRQDRRLFPQKPAPSGQGSPYPVEGGARERGVTAAPARVDP